MTARPSHRRSRNGHFMPVKIRKFRMTSCSRHSGLQSGIYSLIELQKQQSNPHPNPLPWRGKASNIIGSNIFTPTPSGEKKFGNNSATCNIIGGILPRPARTTCLMQRQGLALWLLLRLTKLYQLRTPQFYELYLNVHFRLLPQPLCDQSIQQLLSFVPRSYYPA